MKSKIRCPVRSLKLLCYICGNIGVVGWIVVLVLEGMSLINGIVALAIGVPFVNVVIWLVFKRRENLDANIKFS